MSIMAELNPVLFGLVKKTLVPTGKLVTRMPVLESYCGCSVSSTFCSSSDSSFTFVIEAPIPMSVQLTSLMSSFEYSKNVYLLIIFSTPTTFSTIDMGVFKLFLVTDYFEFCLERVIFASLVFSKCSLIIFY